MKPTILFLALLLSGCADFERGFMASYNRVQNAPVARFNSEQVDDTTQAIKSVPEAFQAPLQPDYATHTGLITQFGQPPAIYSTGPGGTLITQMGHAPIIISP